MFKSQLFPRQTAQGRLESIDALRGIAAISVVLFHFNELPVMGELDQLGRIWKWVWKFGHLGVPAFFVLSGYCIGRSWLSESDPVRFAIRRAKRIFPAYWASLIVILLLAIFRKLQTGTNDVADFPQGVADILSTLAIWTYPASSVKTINWVYWSLSYEIAFYGVMLLLLFVSKIGTRLLALLTVSSVLSICGLWNPVLTATPLFFVSFWPLFALGICVSIWPIDRAIGAGLAVGPALHVVGQVVRGDFTSYSIVACSTAALIILFQSKIIGRTVPSLMVRIGEVSYSLYLIHVPIGCHVFARLLPISDNRTGVLIFAQSLGLIAVLICSWLLYRYVERPFGRRNDARS